MHLFLSTFDIRLSRVDLKTIVALSYQISIRMSSSFTNVLLLLALMEPSSKIFGPIFHMAEMHHAKKQQPKFA